LGVRTAGEIGALVLAHQKAKLVVRIGLIVEFFAEKVEGSGHQSASPFHE
jgi:hypothetical protein